MSSRIIRSLNSLKRSKPAAGFSSLARQVQEPVPKKTLEEHLEPLNDEVQGMLHDPVKVLKWSLQAFNGNIAMSTSFGIQSAILLHLATSVKPDIPVIWVDTGYLPKETYEYAEALRDALDLNLIVKSNTEWSPARMEAKYGNLWETDHKLYGRMRKVDPLLEGINQVEPLALLSGLRSNQTKARANMKPVGFQHNRFKLLPILKMTDDDVESYFDKYDLPRHPLESKGYATVGDWHSSRPVQEGEDKRNTRFGGKFQECGLHVEEEEPIEITQEQPQSQSTLKSFQATNIEALETVKANNETDTAIILVKKIVEDGSFCRKCNDVQQKIEKDGLEKFIGTTLYADLRDSTSEGIRLAKHFEVTTAPFFLTRTKEEELRGEEWKVVKTYLPLRKTLSKTLKAKEL